jgi:hypothetical protein
MDPGMNRYLIRLLLKLYPRAWRDRYGAEVVRTTQDLIAAGETTPTRGALNLAGAALAERGRALADSLPIAVAIAMAALLAVAVSFHAGGHARPQKTPNAASAQPKVAKLAGGGCDFQLGLARGVVMPAADTDTIAVAPGTTQVLIPVDVSAPDGFRPVTFPANLEKGQYVCVVAVPQSAPGGQVLAVPPPVPSGP